MHYRDLRDFIKQLESRNLLKRIEYPVDPYLELTEICDRTLKQQGPALLFTYKNRKPILANCSISILSTCDLIWRNAPANSRATTSISESVCSAISAIKGSKSAFFARKMLF